MTSSVSTCRDVFPSRRSSCVSVSILVGIRFTMAIRSGRISCVVARVSVITNIFSSVSVLYAGSSFEILIGIVGHSFPWCNSAAHFRSPYQSTDTAEGFERAIGKLFGRICRCEISSSIIRKYKLSLCTNQVLPQKKAPVHFARTHVCFAVISTFRPFRRRQEPRVRVPEYPPPGIQWSGSSPRWTPHSAARCG